MCHKTQKINVKLCSKIKINIPTDTYCNMDCEDIFSHDSMHAIVNEKSTYFSWNLLSNMFICL